MKTLLVALVAALCISVSVAQQCSLETNNCGFGTCDRSTLTCVCFEGYTSNRTGCYNCAEGYTATNDGACIRANDPCLNKDCGKGSCVTVFLNSGPAAKCQCEYGWTNIGLPNTTCSRCASGFTMDTNGNCVMSAENPCGTSNDPCTAKPNQVCVFSSTRGATCLCAEGYYRDTNTGACVPKTSGCPNPSPCNMGTCRNSTTSNSGFVCECNPGWAHTFVANTDGTQSVKFCSTCASGYTAVRTLNVDTGDYVLSCEPSSPCTGVDCGFGYCGYNASTTNEPGSSSNTAAFCRCRYNFAQVEPSIPTSPCKVCATGYTNPAADSGLAPCSVCASGYVASGSFCVPATSEPTCPIPCGQFGTCQKLSSGAYACICRDGYIHDPADPIRRPCSVCRDLVSDPTNGCSQPTNFTTCMEACRMKDPNSVCVSASLTTGAFVGFRCACLPQYIPDERGMCTICAPGFYSSTNGQCAESRCPGGCGVGKCVGNFSTEVPVFKCVCPPGYSGATCSIYTPPTVPCDGKCRLNEICVNVETSISGSTTSVQTQRCVCKRNFVDAVAADGSVIPCGKCAPGWAGVDCNVPAIDDQTACGRVVCPEPSVCAVIKPLDANAFITRCLCRDGSVFDPATRCGLATDVPNVDVCPAICPENAICVRSGLTATGTRCKCKEGYRPSVGPDGVGICVPERPAAECPTPCPIDQVCVSSLDFSSSAISQIPKCVCRSPNAYMGDGTCLCRPGFFGPLCGRRANPCELIRCPANSACTVVMADDGSLVGKCVCSGSFTGEGCTVDLCATVKCPEGTRCNNRGQCVCPLNQVLNSDNKCVDRPRTPPTGTVVNTTCSDATNKACILPPPSREISIIRDLADDKELELKRPANTNDNRVDIFGVNFRTTNGQVFAVCIKRHLGLRNSTAVDVQVAIRVCLRLAAIEMHTVPAGISVDEPGVNIFELPIGALNNSVGFDTRTRIVETDISTPEVKATRYTLRTNDGIVRLECFVANVSRAVEDTVTTPSNMHCNLLLSIPAVYYRNPRSKVCLRFIAEKAAESNEGIFSVKKDADTSRLSFFPTNKNGAVISTGADLSFENFAWVGTARVGVSYTYVAGTSGGVVTACINAFSADEIKIDPGFGSDQPFSATEPTSAGSPPVATPAPNGGVTNSAAATSFSAVLIIAFVALVSLLF